MRLSVTGASSLSLFAYRAAAALAAFSANLYLASVLGPEEFGRYALALAFLTFSSFFMDFGYFASGAALLADTRDQDLRSGYAGALIVLGAATSMLFVGIVIALGLTVDLIFPDQVGSLLVVTALAAPALVAPLFVDQILKASARVHLLGAWQALPRAIFLGAIVAGGALGQLTALVALASYLLAGIVGAVIVLVAVRPQLKALRPRLDEIVAAQRSFGRDLYVGKLANLASYNSDRLLLGYFRDAQAVGHYSLAISFAGLVTMFGQSVAAAAFTTFAQRRPISAALLKWNAFGIVVTGAIVLSVGELVIFRFLGPAFAPVATLLVFCLLANAAQAAYQPYNSWLLVNALGVDLKRLLLTVAAINLVANVTLIPIAGATGAALASIIGMTAYLLTAIAIYRQRVLPHEAA
jgi:O-antigen/teichoic acid export membrane protein